MKTIYIDKEYLSDIVERLYDFCEEHDLSFLVLPNQAKILIKKGEATTTVINIVEVADSLSVVDQIDVI